MSFNNFDFTDEDVVKADDQISNPYLRKPEQALKLVTKLMTQPSAEVTQNRDQKIAQVSKLIHEKFVELSNKTDYPESAQLFKKLITIEKELKELIAFPMLNSKTIIGIGGGFSSGKSRFLNTLLQINNLPESLEPTTAIPTYIIKGMKEKVTALNIFDQQAELDQQAFEAITHEFNKYYKSLTGETISFSGIIDLLMVESPSIPWSNITFLDTPGYSKADHNTNQRDEDIAKKQLQQADHIIWAVPAKNGTIKQGDISFLEEIGLKNPLYVVITQADLVSKSDINNIRNSIESNCKKAGINLAGISPWEAPINAQNSFYSDKNIAIWINSCNTKKQITHHQENISNLTKDYVTYLTKKHEQTKKSLTQLNGFWTEFMDVSETKKQDLRQLIDREKHNQQHLDNIIIEVKKYREDLVNQVHQLLVSLNLASRHPKKFVLTEEEERLELAKNGNIEINIGSRVVGYNGQVKL